LTIFFCLWVTFYISANCKLKFTIVDGGVERRCLAVPYELKFTETQTEENHRPIREEIKEDEWLMPRVPGFWLWIRDVHEVFFLGNEPTKLKHIPQKVLDATADFLSAECAAALRDWLDKNMGVADDIKDAITKTALLGRLKDVTPFCDLKPKEREDTLTRTCRIITSKGIRERIKYELKGGDAVFIKEGASSSGS